ncbi:TRAP transporter large permease [Tepidanaerobacter acetatoxydans]|uniref:TRAP transporter large permease n=1 Tax=Tepidanaerobacter acetatoxydans TaxID=499229 RepID=UPI001BD3F2CE|nr:TRAP transporter large permease [Tepidanaerobacter acetatoxydans]
MNLGVLLIVVLLFLSLLGIPMGFALGISTLITLYLGGMPYIVLPQSMYAGVDSFPLLAIPFFMLAGQLMSGGITNKIIAFSNALIGGIKGSLAAVTVVASALFSAISGSGVATVSAIGGITIPAMKDQKYPGAFAAAVASMASVLGPLIPPSIFLIVYGSATETSIGDLFMAAVIPGVGLTLLLVGFVLVVAYKRNFPSFKPVGVKGIIREGLNGIWALLMPILILGGIFLGIFTATEAAAVSAVYALLVSMFIYKDLNVKTMFSAFSKSALTTATLLFVLGASKASSWVIVTSHLPQDLLQFFLSISKNPSVILLLVNFMLLIVGCIMEANCAIVMLSPLLLPFIQEFGISPVHFGVVMALNLCLGLVTPPMGGCILLGNIIAEEKLEQTLKYTLPMLGIGIIWLLLVTYIPQLSLWLPSLSR